MISISKFSFAVLIGATLAGCGGDLSSQDLPTRAKDNKEIFERVSNMSASVPDVVNNTTGSASFNGGALILVGNEGDARALMGDSNVNVNFNDASVHGSITNIFGGTIIDPSEPPATMSPYSGNIALSNGSVESGNAVSVDYTGVLNGNGDRLVLGYPRVRCTTSMQPSNPSTLSDT